MAVVNKGFVDIGIHNFAGTEVHNFVGTEIQEAPSSYSVGTLKAHHLEVDKEDTVA